MENGGDGSIIGSFSKTLEQTLDGFGSFFRNRAKTPSFFSDGFWENHPSFEMDDNGGTPMTQETSRWPAMAPWI